MIKANRINDPQRLNLFTYVRNNPLAFYDPDGRDLKPGTGGDQKKVRNAYVQLAKSDAGRLLLKTLDNLSISITVNVGTIPKVRGEHPYGKIQGEEYTRERDRASGKVVDVKGDGITITVDFKAAAADREVNKALKEMKEPEKSGVPASDAALVGHELTHAVDQLVKGNENTESDPESERQVRYLTDALIHADEAYSEKDAAEFVDDILKPRDTKPNPSPK